MIQYDRAPILPVPRTFTIFGFWWLAFFVAAAQAGATDQTPKIEVALYSGPISGSEMQLSPVVEDSVLQQLSSEERQPPRAGDVSGRDRRGIAQHWKKVKLDGSGKVADQSLRGGFLYLRFATTDEETLVLSPDGVSEVFVDGVPRAGDVYGNGWALLPMKLEPGEHELWCRIARGRTKSIRISKPQKPVYLTDVDATLPDLLATEDGDKWAAIRVVNASERALNHLSIESQMDGQVTTSEISGGITPHTSRKVPFKLRAFAAGASQKTVRVSLLENGRLIDTIDLTIDVKDPASNYRRTFVSDIDGSVQYYGVREGTISSGEEPALFLSVHGAGVKAIGQAGSYQSKDWGHVVAPTNRREFGFDWEDWGRLDAMEVLADAEMHFHTDPARTFLTGHSMGGHGTWYLGALYPSRWAAIAPIAGWRSFFSYPREAELEDPTPMTRMLQRAANPSRTVEMAHNYLHQGIYIEHGDHDETVPVREARKMRELLATFHPDFAYHEEPGGTHWFGVDHAILFDYFRWHSRIEPRDIPTLEFRTPSPGISATSFFVTLYQQEQPYEFSGVTVNQTVRSRRQRRNDKDISDRTIDVATENLSVFKVDLSYCRGLRSLALKVDGRTIELPAWPAQEEAWLKKEKNTWRLTSEPNDLLQKNPRRYGGFKDAFRHHMLFVYATHGTDDENTWSYNKARFDAKTFYYRGNGSIEIIPDDQFQLEEYPDRSVIIYGNATANSAWNQLLVDSPVQVRPGGLKIGDRLMKGDDFGVYMVRPRRDSSVASVGVIAATGTPGRWAVTPNRYFLAGVGFPDLLVVTPDAYKRGVDGTVAAGYFGNDWSVENGSIVSGPTSFPVGGVSDADFVFHSLQFLGVEPCRRWSCLPQIRSSFNN